MGLLGMKRRIAILGSTGSIGTSALSVVDAHAERVEVVALAAGGNVAMFAAQVERYRPRAVAMASGAAIDALKAHLPGVLPAACGIGGEGLIAVATHPEADFVLCASSGTASRSYRSTASTTPFTSACTAALRANCAG
jgi:1-deoxy-D-xylulose-5-phosphate reductoisomerase